MNKIFKAIFWFLYVILLFIAGILIGGFLVPYLIIKRHKLNKLKKIEATSLTRIANSMEAKYAN